MKFSSYVLDQLATDLSKFTAPSIPELTLRDALTLQNHILECVVGPFGGEGNARARHLVTNIVRRVFASIETYKLGRVHALEYVTGDRHARITPYFLALTHFEACIGYSWQICDLMNGSRCHGGQLSDHWTMVAKAWPSVPPSASSIASRSDRSISGSGAIQLIPKLLGISYGQMVAICDPIAANKC